MNNDLRTGVRALATGWELARRPGIRPYVIIPLVINSALFGGLLAWGFHQVQRLNDWLVGYVPDWLDWLAWLLWPLFFLVALLFVMYGFSLVANLIASPFNGLLAERWKRR